jgi:FixJ family two-component response regulator
MPEMNGRDLVERLLAVNPELKYLFMSGYRADIISPQGFLDDKVCFIQKPFSKTDLDTKVRETLRREKDRPMA